MNDMDFRSLESAPRRADSESVLRSPKQTPLKVAASVKPEVGVIYIGMPDLNGYHQCPKPVDPADLERLFAAKN